MVLTRFLLSALKVKVKKSNEARVYVFFAGFIYTFFVVSTWFIHDTSGKDFM